MKAAVVAELTVRLNSFMKRAVATALALIAYTADSSIGRSLTSRLAILVLCGLRDAFCLHVLNDLRAK